MDCKYCDIAFSTELPSCVRCGAPKPSEAIGQGTPTPPEASTVHTSRTTHTNSGSFFSATTYSSTTTYTSSETHALFGEHSLLNDLDVQSLVDAHGFPTESLIIASPELQMSQSGIHALHGHDISILTDRNASRTATKTKWTNLQIFLAVLPVLLVGVLILGFL